MLSRLNFALLIQIYHSKPILCEEKEKKRDYFKNFGAIENLSYDFQTEHIGKK